MSLCQQPSKPSPTLQACASRPRLPRPKSKRYFNQADVIVLLAAYAAVNLKERSWLERAEPSWQPSPNTALSFIFIQPDPPTHHSNTLVFPVRSLPLVPWRCSPSRAWPCPPRPPPSHPTTTAQSPPLSPPPHTRSQPPPPSPAPALPSPSAPSRRPPSLQFLMSTVGEGTRKQNGAKGSTIHMAMRGLATRRRELAHHAFLPLQRLLGRTSLMMGRSFQLR
ncbi:hypothetical protein SEVIR_4G227701v4 [Setaria viridis]